MNEPLLGRPVLEEVVLHTGDMLATAAERPSDVFDVPRNADTASYGTEVARINSGIFHSDRG